MRKAQMRCLLPLLLIAIPHTLAFTTRLSAVHLVTSREHIESNRLTSSVSMITREADETIATSSVQQIDPLLASVLLQADDDDSAFHAVGNIMEASAGLNVWRNILLKGRLPIVQDFVEESCWPPEPFFSAIANAMAEMQLPRFVLRHPDTVSSVLLCMLRLTMDFAKRQVVSSGEETDTIDDDSDDYQEDNDLVVQLTPEELESLAEEIASGLIDQFGGVVQGIHTLDQLFGSGHGLLDVQQEQNTQSGGDAFGLHDGIWEHTGWHVVPELQRQLSSMAELRDLMKVLGRRPTAEGSDALQRFAPRKLDPNSALGAQFDPASRNSVSGLTLSSSLSEMLPSEAVLLRGSSPALRRLFLAKKVESKLLSYELSGWADAPSVPRTRPRYLPRMPSAPGGPLVVCLDTSWSMSGRREWLSKAVVLACITAAHKQGRKCHVVAFSNERGVMDAGEIVADASGIKRLLDFLSNSFGGGTDVTGALKHAMATLGTDAMSAADLLLVTDGEIPDPPVSDAVMEDLDRLKRRTGMQIHGLLVGKSGSKPLTKLCTQTHDFLIGYDTPAAMESPTTAMLGSPWSSALASRLPEKPMFPMTPSFSRSPRWFQRRGLAEAVWRQNHRRLKSQSSGFPRSGNTVPLQARYSADSEEDQRTVKRGKRRRSGGKSRFDDWEDDYSVYEDESKNLEGGQDIESEAISLSGSFNSLVEEAADKLQNAVSLSMQDQIWKPEDLDSEKNAKGSCWSYRGELQSAVERVGENLVERDEESRLVVLGMAAGEHILFLGPPGTGKSALGRRLSNICGGLFFQRLLTRFTTPEEIFGPLSLRALENDEYRRCTAGFLPTASVAFLDEIFKANSAILNTLLTLLNERQFDNGAGMREQCPIRCVVGASNELPESDELDALYDRFLLRKEVLPVSDDGIIKILSMPTLGVSPCDGIVGGADSDSNCDVVFTEGLDRVVKDLSTAADAVHMGEDACILLRDLRTFMREELDVDVSDRRLVKAARLLKISAASHGRARVDPIDCLLLQHVAWRLPEQRSAVREWLWDHLTPGGGASADDPSSSVAAQFHLLLDGLRREALTAVRKTGGDVTGASGGREADIAVIKSLLAEASRITSLLQERAETLARHKELLRRSMDHLWLDPDEARAAQQLLLPKAEAVSTEVNRALAHARGLELALSGSSSASPSNELRLSVLELLWNEEDSFQAERFTDEELSIGMKEAKAKYDLDTFRKWKRARKKLT